MYEILLALPQVYNWVIGSQPAPRGDGSRCWPVLASLCVVSVVTQYPVLGTTAQIVLMGPQNPASLDDALGLLYGNASICKNYDHDLFACYL